jgi:putative heme-binding domain-containing protein
LTKSASIVVFACAIFAVAPFPSWLTANSAELVPLLADRDSWWRETAQRLLFERKCSPGIMHAGDRVQGRQVFKKICATCHQAEGQGFDVGPNLATVANRSPEDLLIHVLDPNREVAPTFVNYNLALVDGRVISGIISLESANAITLKRAQGASDSVARDQIATIAATGVSLMPEGLEKDLSHQDFANLVAFVRSIQAPADKATVPAATK